MAGVEQGNISNKELMSASIVKDKNKKANSWKENGEKFNLSVAVAEVLKTALKLTMEEINLLAAKFPVRRPPCCLL